MLKTLYLVIAVFAIAGCSPSINGAPGADGQDGIDGVDGATGPSGPAAMTCTVEQTELGALVQCPDGSAALVLHGENGKNGKSCSKKSRK